MKYTIRDKRLAVRTIGYAIVAGKFRQPIPNYALIAENKLGAGITILDTPKNIDWQSKPSVGNAINIDVCVEERIKPES